MVISGPQVRGAGCMRAFSSNDIIIALGERDTRVAGTVVRSEPRIRVVAVVHPLIIRLRHQHILSASWRVVAIT